MVTVGFLMLFVGRGLKVLLPLYGTHSLTPVSPEPSEEAATSDRQGRTATLLLLPSFEDIFVAFLMALYYPGYWFDLLEGEVWCDFLFSVWC